MPLWQFFHPPGAFTSPEEKQALAVDITSLYTGMGLPAFYVVVQFLPLDAASFYCGGEPQNSFVRVVINHMAYQSNGNVAAHKRITSMVDSVLTSRLAGKGYSWEYTVGETPETMWKINGLVPPPNGSDALHAWASQNRPVPYEEGS